MYVPHVLQPAFLEALAALQPDLAVTAAYGNMLPTAFLKLPKHGTLNIHPSLLPQYRGAAPVQRALQVSSSTSTSTEPVHRALQVSSGVERTAISAMVRPIPWLVCVVSIDLQGGPSITCNPAAATAQESCITSPGLWPGGVEASQSS
jgi:hypothetical protein